LLISHFHSNTEKGFHETSVINVFFKRNEFSVVQFQRKSTEIEFLSYIGGTLGNFSFLVYKFHQFFTSGLFAGFSFLTFLELFFFFVFHPLVRKLKRSKVEPSEISIEELHDQGSKLWGFIKKCFKYFYHYMEESSLHGLNHASFKNLKAVERIFWLVAFVASMFWCSILLIDMYIKYQNAPLVISFDGDFQNVNSVLD
jgi:hypothetical protein